jgi:hypothetical protein
MERLEALFCFGGYLELVCCDWFEQISLDKAV